MKRFLISLKNNLGTLSRYSLFLIAIAYVIYIFPKEGKFRYEYQKGSTWKHENLIATFDFAIKKSDKELERERDSILSTFKPYYNFQDSVAKSILMELKLDYNKEWNNYKETYLENNKIKKSYHLNKTILDKYFTFAYDLTKFVYSKGILDPIEISDKIKKQQFSIVIQRNRIAEEYDFYDVFTVQSANEYIRQNLQNAYSDKEKAEYDFIANLYLHEYIQPNLVLDEITSRRVKQSLINNISLTHGLVQTGEKIIFRGEVVDDHKFQILESLKYEYESALGNKANHTFILWGQIILIASCFFILMFFCLNFRREILTDTSKTAFILFIILLLVTIASFVIRYNIANIYVVPFALLPIIVKTFFDARLALFLHLTTIFMIGFIAPNGFEFVLLQFTSGISVIFSLNILHRRGQLFQSVAVVVFVYSLVYFGISLTQTDSLININYTNFIWFAANGLLLLSAYPLIYGFERMFGFLSDVTLMELSDTNLPLLRKLAQQAPGTFQHSMQVANLAEEAMFAIGKGNPLLARVGAMYHDIGKLTAPLYFIENQISGINPHDNLEFDKSAEVIINHVNKGVDIAHKYKLPSQLIDFIKTHHGNTKVQYFYKHYVAKFPDKENEIDKFTYPGPKPFSRETAVVMMADSIEAASRSLKTLNAETLSNLVDKIVDFQIKEDQFSNANITFKEISTIRKLFKETLINIYHARIEYPK